LGILITARIGAGSDGLFTSGRGALGFDSQRTQRLAISHPRVSTRDSKLILAQILNTSKVVLAKRQFADHALVQLHSASFPAIFVAPLCPGLFVAAEIHRAAPNLFVGSIIEEEAETADGA